MPSLEAVCTRLLGRPGWIPKVLLGGGLSFIPGLNLFALGYLFIYGRRLRHYQQIDLPEWSEMNWPELFICGLRLFGLLVIYVGVPMVLGWVTSLILYFLTFGLLGVVAYIPLAITGFFSPMIFLAAFIAYLSSLCNVQFSAFQYALLSSFMAFSRTWLAAPAGWLIDNLKWQRYFENFGINQINNPEWVGFFIITALFCLPAIILIYYIDNKRKIS